MKQHIVFLILLALFLPGGQCHEAAAKEMSPFIVSGPPVAESLVFAVMADQHPEQIGFLPWHAPDQARAYIAGGKVDAAIITTSMAAILYNKGLPVRMAGFFQTPLWVISTRSQAGRRHLSGNLVFPFGHKEMPELVFHTVFGDNQPDLAVMHSGSALEAAHLLLLGKANHAVLAEPAASMAIAQSGKKDGPKLIRNLSINLAWQKKFDDRPLYVSTLAVFHGAINRRDARSFINANYEPTRRWIAAHPQETLAIAGKKVPMLHEQLKNQMHMQAAPFCCSQRDFDAARFFLGRLSATNPEMLGGRMPDEPFFRGGD